MIRRALLAAAAPVVAVAAVGPLSDRLARRMMRAPRRLPEEPAMARELDRLGGEVVRLRSRDGLRLGARWLEAEPPGDEGGAEPHVPQAPRGPHVPHRRMPAEPWTPDPRDAILLLHGYSGSVAPDILEYAPFLRTTAGVLGLDFRGHGDSDEAPTTFGMREVEDVAGALDWLAERGVTHVALFGTSMGGITAIASVAVLGDGRLPSADVDPDAPAAPHPPPRPRVVAVVADSVAPELELLIATRPGLPLGRLLARRAFGRMARIVGDDPRGTEPIRVVGLLEDVPLLLVHGEADATVPLRHSRRLVAAAPRGTRHVVIAGADHSRAHRADPARYEAAVTGFLREAFREADADAGRSGSRPYTAGATAARERTARQGAVAP